MTFRWADWARDMRAIALNAKEGIDLAEDHGERLARHHLYVQRLSAMLKKLPDIGDAIEPLEELRDEIDLLVHHHTSDLLRPAKAPRAQTTVADRRLRAIASACVRLFRQVGVEESEARRSVAKLVSDRGYEGAKGRFGPDELANWITKIESGELPGARYVDELFSKLPSLSGAKSVEEATALSKEMLGRIRFPPISGARAKRHRPIA